MKKPMVEISSSWTQVHPTLPPPYGSKYGIYLHVLLDIDPSSTLSMYSSTGWQRFKVLSMARVLKRLKHIIGIRLAYVEYNIGHNLVMI